VTAELRTNWPNDPNKCGPPWTAQSQPYNANWTYQVTATVHLWSGPSTSSTPIAIIRVTNNGPGGIGCPSGRDPTVTVQCKTTGHPIEGPFGTDRTWEKVSVTSTGQTGFLPDEWLDTRWDVSSFPSC
jgi:hypothetical protein